jgi:hypothetical protein
LRRLSVRGSHGGLGTASIGSASLSAQIITMNLFITD